MPSRGTVVAVAVALLAAAAVIPGCTSIRSRRIENPRNLEEVGGMPIMVQRPRWLMVTQKQVGYGYPVHMTVRTPGAGGVETNAPESSTGGSSGSGDLETGGSHGSGRAAAPGTVREFSGFTRVQDVCVIDFKFINVGELYAVDLLRPAAGSITDAQFQFDAEKTQPEDAAIYQYPIKVGAQVDDDTLTTVTDMFPKLKEALFGKESPESYEVPDGMIEIDSRITRITLYDVRRPGAPPILLTPAAPGRGCLVPSATGGGR